MMNAHEAGISMVWRLIRRTSRLAVGSMSSRTNLYSPTGYDKTSVPISGVGMASRTGYVLVSNQGHVSAGPG
jgi:hypothetical protein